MKAESSVLISHVSCFDSIITVLLVPRLVLLTLNRYANVVGYNLFDADSDHFYHKMLQALRKH